MRDRFAGIEDGAGVAQIGRVVAEMPWLTKRSNRDPWRVLIDGRPKPAIAMTGN